MAQRLTAADFDPELLILFDAYVHGALDRRGFLDKAKKYRGGRHDGGDAARRAEPEVRRSPAGEEGRRAARDVVRRVPVAAGQRQGARLPGPAGQRGRQAAGHPRGPREPRPQPAHRGHRAAPRPSTTSWRSRPTRCSRSAATPATRTRRARCSRSSIRPKTREDFVAAAGLLQGRGPTRTGKIGAVGFCYGGGIVNMLATRMPDLAAARAVLRRRPAGRGRAEDQGGAADPVRRERRAHQRAVAGLRGRAEGGEVKYEAHIYPGTQHGFNNDTTPRYDEKNAKLAWERTMAHFAKHVKG